MPTDQALLHLLHLVSPSLPIGMFAYSQGLETAVQQGWIKNAQQASAWISGLLQYHIGQMDLPVLQRLYQAFQQQDTAAVNHWNQYLYACRETQELRAEEIALGRTLARLLRQLDVPEAATWYQRSPPICYASLFALAMVHWQIPLATGAQGYAWSWLENQVAAAVKLVPLGQSEGQSILLQCLPQLPHYVEHALTLNDDQIGATTPALAFASAWHETQYARLFRS